MFAHQHNGNGTPRHQRGKSAGVSPRLSPLPRHRLHSGANPPLSARDENELGVEGGAGKGRIGGEEGWVRKEKGERKRGSAPELLSLCIEPRAVDSF